MVVSVSGQRLSLRLILFVAFLLLCVVAGGSSRADNPSQLIVRPLSVLFAIAVLMWPGPRYWSGLRWPLLLIAAFAATMALQLVPLPPAIWLSLPGHARFAAAATAAGVAQPWRPISASPDMTFNSLLALLVPLATLLGSALIAPAQRSRLIPAITAAMIASAVIGIAQWAGSQASPLYFYRYTNRDLPVGFFANRNHQAVFLAMALPLLRCWAVLPSMIVAQPRLRAWIAGAAALLIVPVVLASGSRSGLVMTVLAAIAAFVIAPPDRHALSGMSRKRMLIPVAAALIVVAIAIGVLVTGRAVSITRVGQLDQVDADLRFRYLPIVLGIAKDYLPFGTGYGSFDAMFRIYEPFWALKRTYFNHAHNDLLELVMTGGLPALLVLITGLGFLGVRLKAAWSWGRDRTGARMVNTGAALIAIAFAASLTDYPLRTPAMAMIFALATVWLATPLEDTRRGAPDERGGGLPIERPEDAG
jgi:O-antigen ligase